MADPAGTTDAVCSRRTSAISARHRGKTAGGVDGDGARYDRLSGLPCMHAYRPFPRPQRGAEHRVKRWRVLQIRHQVERPVRQHRVEHLALRVAPPARRPPSGTTSGSGSESRTAPVCRHRVEHLALPRSPVPHGRTERSNTAERCDRSPAPSRTVPAPRHRVEQPRTRPREAHLLNAAEWEFHTRAPSEQPVSPAPSRTSRTPRTLAPRTRRAVPSGADRRSGIEANTSTLRRSEKLTFLNAAERCDPRASANASATE